MRKWTVREGRHEHGLYYEIDNDEPKLATLGLVLYANVHRRARELAHFIANACNQHEERLAQRDQPVEGGPE